MKSFVKQALEAVQQVHDAGYVHLDVKIENFLIDTTTERLMLADFGYSQKIEKLDVQGLIGSPYYRAPEINLLDGDERMPITTAADVCSLGVMIFRVISFCLINSLYK